MKYRGEHKDKFVFVVFSPNYTPAMEISFKHALEYGIECIWIRHVQSDYILPIPTLRESIKVRELKSDERFLESFLYEECRLIDPKALFVIAASDEIFTPEIFQKIIEMSEIGGISWESVGINRIWVKKRKNDWFFSNLASKDGFDIQYRIFSPYHTRALRKVHTPGFKLRGKRSLIDGAHIIHLDWHENSLEKRRNKLLYYEQLQRGQFVSKFRYYLPECFTEIEQDWQVVPYSVRDCLYEYEACFNRSN